MYTSNKKIEKLNNGCGKTMQPKQNSHNQPRLITKTEGDQP